jgi:acyl transferase domain-containing protein
MYTRFGAFIPAVLQFDANAFSTTKNEAMAMDPQQRLLLEEVGMALDCKDIGSVDMYEHSTGRL